MLDDIIMTLSHLPVVLVRGAAAAVPPTVSLCLLCNHCDITGEDSNCHRQIFGRETLSDLTAKSSAIEKKRGLQVLYDACDQDRVAL